MNFMIFMVKKVMIEEIFSKAKFADNPDSYKVFFRDFDQMVEMKLPEFIVESNNFETIPVGRIEIIKKDDEVLFKNQNKW